MKPFIPLVFACAILPSHACDICGSYTALSGEIRHGDLGTHVGVAEQYTRFGSLRLDGHEVSNPADQYLNSSITQIVLGKSYLNNRLLLQANVPLIHRDYRRTEGLDIDEGTEAGLGDISLIASYEILRLNPSPQCDPMNAGDDSKRSISQSRGGDVTVSMDVFGGIKLPTGDSGRLEEEFHEDHDHEDHDHEDAPESGIHGHDLALGSGSVDAVIGADLYARRGNWFFQGELQYAIRSEGDYDYRYANDLTWTCGPGWYALRESDRSLALQFVISGETKDTDRFNGETAEDTGLTAVYLGPRILGSYGAFSGELGLDLPVVLDNTALQAVPDYRIRAAITFRF
jgi:hypothetical protein